MSHEHYGYGFFPGGDPRRFSPDTESNTPKELQNHKDQCAAWDRGERPDTGAGCNHGVLKDTKTGEVKGSFFVCGGGGLGMGSYSYDCDDPGCDEDERQTGPEFLDPDDGPAQFAAWWERDGQAIAEETEWTRLGDRELASAAFLAGFRARESDPPPARVEGEPST